MDNNIKYLVALSAFPKFGPKRLGRISNYFDNYESAYRANLKEYIDAGIEEKVASEFIGMRLTINIDSIIEKLEKENIRVITLRDKEYPEYLAEIYDPPHLLYYKGKLNASGNINIAIVGARKYTHYGKQIIEKIVPALVANNITIVSGLALGVDTEAHNATLENGGNTIAVLGTGIDTQCIYPSANRHLAEKIIANDGAIISEFPLGTPPLKHHFPQRNRIIAGLSIGTLVVEAGERSGALITARNALDQNREVYAVPGNIFSPVSIGPNNLIKQGAKTVTKAEDILESLDLNVISSYIDNKKIIPTTPEEKLIIEHLSHEPIHIDELVRLTKQNISAINSTLTMMEMKGMIKNLGGTQYILSK